MKLSEHIEGEKLDIAIAEARERVRLKEGLPHIYRYKWYPWARRSYESVSKIHLLCAANQVSKSSTQIRKCINWATDKTLWPKLWNHDPVQFWYLYPTSKQVNSEFETKWKQFLPKGEFKNDPLYGWHEEKYHGDIVAIHFNSGVHVYFKTYSQNAASLQSGTCDAIFCDEELPVHLFSELIFRISASDGYFHMVFTATLGQDFWRCAMEVNDLAEGEVETLPEAEKICVSLYECQEYEDGTASHWTPNKIKQVEARCATHSEVLRRVMGRFVLDKGQLKYPEFDLKRHMKIAHHIPKSWLVYGGVDVGGGDGNEKPEIEGKTKKNKAHPAAILFVAVRPDYRQGRVFLGWRGDDIVTTAGDVYLKFKEIEKANGLNVVEKVYDWGSKDFDTIATRNGDYFEPANKSHDIGEGQVNVLFKNDMLYLYDHPEVQKLGKELSTLRNKGKKQKNDLADTLRYIVCKIPWDYSAITGVEVKYEGSELSQEQVNKLNSREAEIAERRKAFNESSDDGTREIEAEFEEANESYGY